MRRTIFFLWGDSYPLDLPWEGALRGVLDDGDTRFITHAQTHFGISEGRFLPIADRIVRMEEALCAVAHGSEIFVIGRSSGARTATLLAARSPRVTAVACISYPFRNPGQWIEPERFAHLASFGTPMLLIQGTYDQYGGIELTENYQLSEAIRLRFVPGDHHLQPGTPSGRYVLEQIPAYLNGGWRDGSQNIAAFDEEFYLSAHPGVAEAVAAGNCASGLKHFQDCGRREGRKYRMRVEETGA